MNSPPRSTCAGPWESESEPLVWKKSLFLPEDRGSNDLRSAAARSHRVRRLRLRWTRRRALGASRTKHAYTRRSAGGGRPETAFGPDRVP